MLAHKAEDEGLGRRGCMCGVGVHVEVCIWEVHMYGVYMWGVCVGVRVGCMWRCTLYMCGGVQVCTYVQSVQVSINVVNMCCS